MKSPITACCILIFAQVPSLSPSQKSKYTILNPDPPSNGLGGGGGGREVEGRAGSANNVPTTKLDQVPDPKMTLFRRDQVQDKSFRIFDKPIFHQLKYLIRLSWVTSIQQDQVQACSTWATLATSIQHFRFHRLLNFKTCLY